MARTTLQTHAAKPSVKFFLTIQPLALNADNHAKHSRTYKVPAFTQATTKFCETIVALRKAVEEEEEKRPQFGDDLPLFREQKELESESAREQQNYETAYSEYETQLAEVRRKLATITGDVDFKIGGTQLVIEKGIAGQLGVDLDITEGQQNLEEAIEDEGCCARCLPFCCGSKDITKDKAVIADAQQKRKLISQKTERGIAESTAATTRLMANREALLADEARLLQLQRGLTNKSEPLKAKLAKIIAHFKNGEEPHLSAISNKLMLLIVVSYYWLENILDQINKLDTTPITAASKKPADEKTNLLSAQPPTPETLKTMFHAKYKLLSDLLNVFWCPHSNNAKPVVVYGKFKFLDEKERAEILKELTNAAPATIAKILPLGELASEIITYHPAVEEMPANCAHRPVAALEPAQLGAAGAVRLPAAAHF